MDFKKWMILSEALSEDEKRQFDMMQSEVVDELDTGNYSMYLIHSPNSRKNPFKWQLYIQRSDASAWGDQHTKLDAFKFPGEGLDAGRLMSEKVKEWVTKISPEKINIVSMNQEKTKKWGKLAKTIGLKITEKIMEFNGMRIPYYEVSL